MEHDRENDENIKSKLSTLEQLLGPKIYFHTRDLFRFGEAQESSAQCAKLFGFDQGPFPARYMGIPTHDRTLSNS
jgi:hypothetical protein